MKQKIEIILKSVEQYGKIGAQGLHSLEPSYEKILELIDEALKDGFSTIYVYSKRGFASRTNIFKNSTWNRLRRDLDADVRAGMVQRQFGQYLGDGFTIYFK